MRKLIVGAAAALLLGAAAPDKAGEAADLGWLAGAWLSREADGSWTEERWAPPRGGVMLGTSLAGSGGKAGWYEFMRIAADGEGRLAFHASPGGAPPSAFPLVSHSAREAVFENPAHDYPTRIAYRRKGDVLSATISGPGGAKARSWRFRKVG
jgi:hypothetical protein